MTETVAAWSTYGPAVIPLPHPSWRSTVWLRRNPWFEQELAPYLRSRVAALLGEAATAEEAPGDQRAVSSGAS
jgi:uracil-DNA glycosylase